MTQRLIISTLSGLLLMTACKHECSVVKKTYDNGQEQEVLIYPDCKDTTYYKSQTYYKNGQISSEGFIKSRQKTGKFKSWAKNGNQTAEWQVWEGKEHGFIQCWYNNGIKKKEVTLDRGLENGHEITWYETGKRKSEGEYIQGKKEGQWFYWDEDGSWKLRIYKRDSLWGPTIEHLIDSTTVTLVSGQYENGKEAGLWRWFDKDSILYETAVYQSGKLTGDIHGEQKELLLIAESLLFEAVSLPLFSVEQNKIHR